MLKSFIFAILAAVTVHIVKSQWPNYQYPYYYNNVNNPTFSHLNPQPTTQPPYLGYYNPGSSDASVRIWPYVVDQYLYPSNYNANFNNPAGALPSWSTWYTNPYAQQAQWGK